MPEYTLFQRDRGDAPEPMSMLYYDPQVTGQFWQGLALDYHFTNDTDSWASMRSSWTDNNGLYVAMKSSVLTGHQTHGDLDGGDFVLDALGQRWAGELGNGDYLSEGYVSRLVSPSLSLSLTLSFPRSSRARLKPPTGGSTSARPPRGRTRSSSMVSTRTSTPSPPPPSIRRERSRTPSSTLPPTRVPPSSPPP